MSLISGCQEGKVTPRLVEVKCPKCYQYVEVFIIMGGNVGQTGTLSSSESCACGHILLAGTYETEYEK